MRDNSKARASQIIDLVRGTKNIFGSDGPKRAFWMLNGSFFGSKFDYSVSHLQIAAPVPAPTIPTIPVLCLLRLFSITNKTQPANLINSTRSSIWEVNHRKFKVAIKSQFQKLCKSFSFKKSYVYLHI